MTKTRRLKRTELYALVWSRATMHVAKELGLSGVGLGKLCRRHDVPVPGRGYWTLLQHGHKPKQTALPQLPSGQDPWIEIHASAPQPGISGDVAGGVSLEAQVEFTADHLLTIDEAVTDIHRSLRGTAGELRRRKPDETGRIRVVRDGCFPIYVAPANLERSVRILQALCIGFDHRQYLIVKKQGEAAAQELQISVKDEPLGFSLEERVRKVRHEPTEAETARAKREPWFKIRKYHEEPTGKLVLKLEGLPVYGSQPLQWADTERVRLEERLNEFMAGLIDSANARKVWRAEQERLRLEREERERTAAEKEARAQIERARRRFLEAQANLWRRRERLRSYVEAVRQRLASGEHSPEQQARAVEWVEWAEGYLQTRDATAIPFFNPLIKKGSRLFDAYAWHGGYGERDEWFDLWGS